MRTPARAALAALALGLAACGGTKAPEVVQPPLTPPALACSAAGVAASDAAFAADASVNTVCVLTSEGELVLALDPVRAPVTVANFLAYAASPYYAQTIVHRVERTPLRIFQAGAIGVTSDWFMFLKGPTHPAIALESANGLSNLRGTIAMARTDAPDSAQAQFYVNVQDNTVLDHRPAGDPLGAFDGYAVFGRVISGMDAVDRIGAAPTVFNSASYPELPNPAVLVYWTKQLR